MMARIIYTYFTLYVSQIIINYIKVKGWINMLGMQYKVILPKDYDMELIRNRVQNNRHKTDGFPGLYFKMYLITEKEIHRNLYNSYAPLYLWNDIKGMNKFVFEGYYDNILESFGWQQINIGVPYSVNLDNVIDKVRYVVEYAGNIPEGNSLKNTSFIKATDFVENAEKSVGDITFYNPDKWGYSQFSFFHEKPMISSSDALTLYEVLHVSQ